ncbi:MAG TPA: uracil-DNA glycosylase [Roseiflexaceae bacterium]|nr:uracil-DNA glycosylase [Roseiflexaceae bacterium]
MIRLLDDQACVRCPALVASRSRIVHGYGDPGARIVFVGEAPGQHGADRTGVPFSGDRSGRVLQRILIALGLCEDQQPGEQPRLRCFVTNVVRCCPPANRTPTPREQASCAPFLAAELETIDPWIVVPIGLPALRAVARRYLDATPSAIRPLHAMPIYQADRVIVPLIHPSRISRAQIEAFVATMRRVLEPLRR